MTGRAASIPREVIIPFSEIPIAASYVLDLFGKERLERLFSNRFQSMRSLGMFNVAEWEAIATYWGTYKALLKPTEDISKDRFGTSGYAFLAAFVRLHRTLPEIGRRRLEGDFLAVISPKGIRTKRGLFYDLMIREYFVALGLDVIPTDILEIQRNDYRIKGPGINTNLEIKTFGNHVGFSLTTDELVRISVKMHAAMNLKGIVNATVYSIFIKGRALSRKAVWADLDEMAESYYDKAPHFENDTFILTRDPARKSQLDQLDTGAVDLWMEMPSDFLGGGNALISIHKSGNSRAILRTKFVEPPEIEAAARETIKKAVDQLPEGEPGFIKVFIHDLGPLGELKSNDRDGIFSIAALRKAFEEFASKRPEIAALIVGGQMSIYSDSSTQSIRIGRWETCAYINMADIELSSTALEGIRALQEKLDPRSAGFGLDVKLYPSKRPRGPMPTSLRR